MLNGLAEINGIICTACLVICALVLLIGWLIIAKHQRRLVQQQQAQQQEQLLQLLTPALQTLQTLKEQTAQGQQLWQEQQQRQQTHWTQQLLTQQEFLRQMQQQQTDLLQQQLHALQQRLTVVDEAQKHLQQFSDRVLNLQQLLVDKRARGALGEMQLTWILQNALPTQSYTLQTVLSNQCRADSILLLPPPIGKIAVDAKFPLDNYRKMVDERASPDERKLAGRAFAADVRKHIQDVAAKYIIPGETATSALLFIPAETIFTEIHSNYPELISLAYQKRVWIVSPTTLMAVLTTAGMVIKDLALQQHTLEIQHQLKILNEEFIRFAQRSESYAHHLQLTLKDWQQLQITIQKLLVRFDNIINIEQE